MVVLLVLVWDNHGFIHRPGWAPSQRVVKTVFKKSTQSSNQDKSSLQIIITIMFQYKIIVGAFQ